MGQSAHLIPDHGFGLIVGRITQAADSQQTDLIEIFGPSYESVLAGTKPLAGKQDH